MNAPTMDKKKPRTPPTTHTRIKTDLVDKLGWIKRHREVNGEEFSVSDFLDPHIRSVIEAEFDQIKKWADGVKRAESGGK